MSGLFEIGLNNALMAAVLALVAAAVAARKPRPALVHGLWLLVFLKLLTPPLVTLPVPSLWDQLERHLPASTSGPEGHGQTLGDDGTGWVEGGPESGHQNSPWADLPTGNGAGTEEDAGAPSGSGAPAAAEFDDGRSPIAPSAEDRGLTSAFASGTSQPSSRWSDFWRGVPVYGVLGAVWLVGSLLWFGVSAVLAWRVCRLLAFARPAPQKLQEEVRRLARRLKLTRCPDLHVVSGHIAPMVWPIGRRPRILLPKGLLDQLSPQEQSAVLAHELAHVRRRDHWVRLLEFVATGLYWWHPVIWWARAQLRRAEEECCDAWVTSTWPELVQTYAAALLDTIDFLSRPPGRRPILSPVGSGTGTVRLLKRRLTMIYHRTAPTRLGRGARIALAVTAALLLPLVPGRARSTPPAPSAASEPSPAVAAADVDIGAPGPAEESSFRLSDPFEGKLDLSWEPVRPDPTHVSLTKNPGKLTITTQCGGICFDEKNRTAKVQTKNLYLIRNPAAPGGDFVITTCIESFRPTLPYQQAGLLIYNDDDNFVKANVEHDLGSVTLLLGRETNQDVTFDRPRPPLDCERLWLRMTKRGRYYVYSYSTDGEQYTVATEGTWGTGAAQWVGVFASNGPVSDAADMPNTHRFPAVPIDAVFDFFQVRSLTPEEKDDLSLVEKERLQGTWEVASCRFDGKLLEKPPLSRFTFEGIEATVLEGIQSIRTQYALDVTQEPRELRLSGLFARDPRPVRAVYSVRQGVLVLCFHPKPEAPVPDKLETKEGDGRFLVTLRRMSADEDAAIRRTARPMMEYFQSLDRNDDDRLVLEEYTADRATPDALKQGAELFKVLDQDGDGELTPEEFKARPRQALFLLWDLNADGGLSVSEFFHGEMRTASAEQARRTFELVDQDGDGLVSLKESLARTPEAWFAKQDTDENDRVSFSEYEAGNRALARNNRCETVFALIDRNGDRSLSLEEFKDTPEEAFFHKKDADADRKLSFSEFAVWLKTPQQIEDGKKRFAAQDADGDGLLTFREYAYRSADAAFWKADQDGDDRLSLDEFKATRPTQAADEAEADFKALDRNGDARISLEESQARPE
jgi:uncharacterized protein (TIGR03067 family)